MRRRALAGLAFLLASAGAAWPQSATTPVRVGTVLAAARPVTPGDEYVGRVEAVERVDIRARVTGYLEAVLFKEGDTVEEGAKLFQIEQEPFQAAVQQAQGALLHAQAEYTNATAQAERTQELVKTDAASRANLDRRLADQQSAQGDIVTADGNLKSAQINLGYTEILAPITGRAGRASVTKGNVVGPDSGVLTTIVSKNPMYVVFPVSQREFLHLEGERDQLGTRLVVKIAFSNGQVYEETGTIDFIDIAVDRATDSVTVRATVPNPNDKLIDGQLVRVLVQGETPDMKILVPQSALVADQQGFYVFVVTDGKAAVRRVKTGDEVGADVVIDSGLEPGDQVIAEGTESLRAGTPVTAAPLPPTPGRG
jgi:membrane fusion protein (multidrug efflux system)